MSVYDDVYRELNEMATDKANDNQERSGLWDGDGYEEIVPLVSWSQLVKKEFPDIKWRIKNLIPMAGFVLLASVSGEKKTWLALEMARCVSEEIPFGGDPRFEVVKGKVLYIDGEMAQGELQRRCKQLGFGATTDGVFFLSPKNLNLNNEEGARDLMELIEREKFSVVIIDTFRAVAGGLKEEKAEEVRKFYGRFKPLKDKNVACIFLDHSRKPNHFEGTKPKKEQVFSSQDKVANCEVLLMLQGDKQSGGVNIYQHKNRLVIELRPFALSMTDTLTDDGQTRTVIKYAGELEEDGAKKDQAKEAILALLEDGPKTQPEIIEINQKQHDIGSKNTRLALQELGLEKKVIKSKTGKKNCYTLTPEPLLDDPP